MDVHVIGVPMDLGADRRGVDMGPSAIRYAGLADAVASLGHGYTDAGDVLVTRPERADPDGPEPRTGRAEFLAETRDVSVRLTDRVADVLESGAVPLVLGGDHSIAIGSVGGSARGADVGVVWFDAHGDYNTPATTPSGNVHGMSLAAALGVGEFGDYGWASAGVDPANVSLVGVRDLDDGERAALRESPIDVFTVSRIDERGIGDVTRAALDAAAAEDGIHVSLDLDWLDPGEAPGVGTPVRGGVTYREAHTAMELVAERELRSLELVEVNPIRDRENATAELAVELAASALGRRIL